MKKELQKLASSLDGQAGLGIWVEQELCMKEEQETVPLWRQEEAQALWAVSRPARVWGGQDKRRMLVGEKKGLNFNKTGKTRSTGNWILISQKYKENVDFLGTSPAMSPGFKRDNTFKERSAGRLLAGTRCEVMENWIKIVELGLQNGICSSISKLASSF